MATVVLPTPPFGLKTAITVARRCQAPSSDEPVWITGPEPSSTVIDRMHIASTRQRRASGEYGRVKNSSPASARDAPEAIASRARGDRTMSAGIAWPSWRRA